MGHFHGLELASTLACLECQHVPEIHHVGDIALVFFNQVQKQLRVPGRHGVECGRGGQTHGDGMHGARAMKEGGCTDEF